ncbi:MAG: YqzL family protein [Clostridiales bacterium]|jgi:hypothetical protein|nr:YqzL family protein [Eubacteriales bacterium]MDH7565330.1 YqzL family protein [Clostridiales bacterium]
MLKDFVWKVFENTGNIDDYIFFKELEGVNETVDDKKGKAAGEPDMVN